MQTGSITSTLPIGTYTVSVVTFHIGTQLRPQTSGRMTPLTAMAYRTAADQRRDGDVVGIGNTDTDFGFVHIRRR